MSMTSVAVPLFEGEQVPMVWPGSPMVHKSDPIESHLAADSISAEGVRDSQTHVLLDLRGHGRSAAWEIERRADGRWSPSRIRTALAELEESGLVVRHKMAGVTRSGRVCAMFEVTA